MTTDSTPSNSATPQNGIPGLKHIRYDILSGIVISLVSLPLSSGIAIASGAPPIYGLISAVVAGIVFSLIGGAYLTVAGPAAGLAPAILAVMVTLGGAGDAETLGAGYSFLLVIGFMVGCVQIVMSVLKLARFATIIPVSVVEGMLASIGLLIIVKQLPMFFGYTGKVQAHEFFEYLSESPHFVQNMTGAVFGVAMASLVLLFLLAELAKRISFFRIVPPQLLAVIIGAVLAYAINLGAVNQGKFLIKLPESPFHGIKLPDFAGLFARHDLWYVTIMGTVTLALIASVESIATAMAIDRIDPFHRKYQPNRLLLAMGCANIASSLFGGMVVCPGGVKSKVNVASGGRTIWANFSNAICLIVYLMAGQAWINMIPKGVLASVLIFTGWKMCEPIIWRHMAKIGKEQLALFAFTVLITLMTDLLVGIIAGVVAKYFLNLFLCSWVVTVSDRDFLSVGHHMIDFFRNPVARKTLDNGELTLYVDKPLVCFNSMNLESELIKLDSGVTSICVHFDAKVLLIDHTSCETLFGVIDSFARRNIPVRVVGMERMLRLSKHIRSVHISGSLPLPQTY